MQPNMKYKFYLTNREFTATFVKICSPYNTLIVSNYLDENGCVPGTRTMPFSWVKGVEILNSECEIETIHLDNVPNSNRQIYSRNSHINNLITNTQNGLNTLF